MKKVTCTGINGEKQKVSADELSFRPSVYGICIRDNSVLLVPQWDGWDFPGGGVDVDETIDEAFSREVKEETGLEVSRGKVVACESSFFIHHNTGKYHNCLLIYYLGENVKGEISTKGFTEDEVGYAKEAKWVSLDEIEKLKFYNSIDSMKLIKTAMEIRSRDL